VEERERRLAENEALFREVNERTQAVNQMWSRAAGDEPPFQIVCECGHADCSVPLHVSPALYESVREHGARFLVASGHELPDVERILERHDELLVIEKTGASKPIAERFDPRKRN